MRSAVVVLTLLLATGCPRPKETEVIVRNSDKPAAARGASLVVRTTGPHVTPAIDWRESAGIFIGIEQFDSGVEGPPPVAYAVDDAIRLACFFAKEKRAQPLLAASRTALLIAGKPHTAETRQCLEELERDGLVVRAGGGVSINAATIYRNIDRLAGKVGRNGILILSISTHGYTVGNQQLFLTSDSLQSQRKGVFLERMLQVLQQKPGRRLLLFADTCRTPGSGPPFTFADVDLPAGFAVLSASSPRWPAWAPERLRNGIFTYALMEGLRCHASSGPDGAVSPRELHENMWECALRN